MRQLEQGGQARDKLLEQLIDTVEFPLPESAVTAEIEYREHDVMHSIDHNEELLATYLEAQGQTREEWDAELRESAEKAVRAQFILDAIAEKAEVQIGDGELTEYLVRQAQRYQMAPQEFANQIMQSGNLPMLVADIRRNKALSEVLDSAVVTDASGNTVDLAALNPPVEDEVADDEVAADDASEPTTLPPTTLPPTPPTLPPTTLPPTTLPSVRSPTSDFDDHRSARARHALSERSPSGAVPARVLR